MEDVEHLADFGRLFSVLDLGQEPRPYSRQGRQLFLSHAYGRPLGPDRSADVANVPNLPVREGFRRDLPHRYRRASQRRMILFLQAGDLSPIY